MRGDSSVHLFEDSNYKAKGRIELGGRQCIKEKLSRVRRRQTTSRIASTAVIAQEPKRKSGKGLVH